MSSTPPLLIPKQEPSSVVKTETPSTPSTSSAPAVGVGDPAELDATILRLCTEFPDGITGPDLETRTTTVSQEERTGAINRLLSGGKIEMKSLGGSLLFKLKSQESLDRIKGASQEETIVYSLIEDAKTKGIWVRDILVMSNIPRKQLNKVLKSLEGRKLVKSIKAVGPSKRKEVYMLYDLVPDSDLTGGAFYADQEFDAQFVDALNYQATRYLKACAQRAADTCPQDILARRDMAGVSSVDVWKHVKDSGLCRVELSIEDVERILNTLVFDGVAERTPTPRIQQGKEYPVFRAVEGVVSPGGIVRVPCTFCPVFKDCRPGGEVSPASCTYFKDWLNQL